MHRILREIAHRPWPLPDRPWVMAQSWHDLLFAHWPVSAADLRPLIPAALQIDSFRGRAWLGVVPFRMTGVRLRGAPGVPGLSAFPELNVRTYVVSQGKPGVWFFSLDAGNAVAVAIARAWFHLPYFHARMSLEEQSGWIDYRSARVHRGASAAELRGKYRAAGDAFFPEAGTLEHWLTERYCLYAADGGGRILRGEIHHPPWLLQPAQAEFACNTMAAAAGVELPQPPPLLHFARRQDVIIWPPRRVQLS
jgi:uncharacterized protein YqjF (DUF2071 family)